MSEIFKEDLISKTPNTLRILESPSSSRIAELKRESKSKKAIDVFKRRFREDNVTPLIMKHLDHEEDLIFYGRKGVEFMLGTMEDVIELLSTNVSSRGSKTTRKWDGAPAVLCASDFNGEKFIALKHSWDKSKDKRFHNVEEIEANYSGEDKAPLREKLVGLFECIDKIAIPRGEIWMGDYLFSTSDLEKVNIDGVSYVNFLANVVNYAVPLDDPFADKILNAKVGIVWHTKYTGDSIDNLQKSFNVDVSVLKDCPEIAQFDANLPSIKDTALLPREDVKYLERLIDEARTEAYLLVSNPGYDELVANDTAVVLIQKWKNTLIRQNRTELEHLTAEKVIQFIHNDLTNKMMKYKKQATIDKYTSERDSLVSFLREHSDVIDTLYATQEKCIVAKNTLLQKLENAYNSNFKFKNFYLSKSQGYIPCGGEGFVVSDIEGNVAKIVSRVEFSYNNWADDTVKNFTKKEASAPVSTGGNA